MAPKSIASVSSTATNTPKRVKNPLRIFKVFSPKSKNKGQSQSTTSLPAQAQAPASAPVVPKPSLPKPEEVAPSKVIESEQKPVDTLPKAKEEDKEEKTHAPIVAEVQPEPEVASSDNAKEPEARDSQEAPVSEPTSEPTPEQSEEVNVARHSVESTTATVVEEQPLNELVVVVAGEKLLVKQEAVEERDEKEIPGRDADSEARDETLASVTEPENVPEATRPAVVDALPRDLDDSKLASSLETVDLTIEEPMAATSASEEAEKVVLETSPESHSPSQPSALEEATKPLVDVTADINPFVVEDSDEPLSDNEQAKETDEPLAAETVIPTDAQLSPSAANAPSSPPKEAVVDHPLASPPAGSFVPVNVNKDVPPPPTSTSPSPAPAPASDTSSEEEAPELHTPALVAPTLFLPIPNIDPLTTLLIKHVPEPHLRPPRDLSGEWQQSDFHTLVMSNNWRALARMARDRIVLSSPSDVEVILNLWYIRLSSLARLRLFNQTSAECENLFSALATIDPPASRTYILEHILPFELEVIRARCSYWAGDHLGYIDDLSALLRRSKSRARKARDQGERSMWKERGARMCLIIASQLVEMKDYTAATSLLEPLCASGGSSPELRSSIARIYLQGGYIALAAHHFALVDADAGADAQLKDMNALILAAANGDWPEAESRAKKVMAKDPENIVATSNCAVALVCLGKLKEAIQVLEGALQASPLAVTTAEPYLFNLSTLYELRAGLTLSKKRDLLIEVAKWSGDGLRTTCLKMG